MKFEKLIIMKKIIYCLFMLLPFVAMAQTQPTGKTRQLQYKLHPGEAGWVLKVENSTEF